MIFEASLRRSFPVLLTLVPAFVIAAPRTIQFPSDRACGALMIRETGGTWQPRGDAWGEVTIDDGKTLRLVLDEKSTQDLSFLFLLKSDDLEEIAFDHYPIVNSQLAALKPLTELRGLAIIASKGSVKGVGDDGLKLLGHLQKLERLNLSNNPVYGRGLTALSNMPKLAELDLSGTQVSDDTVGKLSALGGLTKLSLANTIVTDVGLDRLAGLTTLKVIDLHGSKVTPAGIDKLKGAIAGLEVISGAGDVATTTPAVTEVATGTTIMQPEMPKSGAVPGAGAYELSVKLQPGEYEYKIYLEGPAEWMLDPLNPVKKGEDPYINSTFSVPGGAVEATGRRSPYPKVDDATGMVTFEYTNSNTQGIPHVLGSWNTWVVGPGTNMKLMKALSASATEAAHAGTEYTMTIKLEPGEYKYQFYSMKQNKWFLDPLNPVKGLNEGYENSAFTVPGGAVTADGTRSEWPKVNDKTGEVTFLARIPVAEGDVHLLGTFNKYLTAPENVMKAK